MIRAFHNGKLIKHITSISFRPGRKGDAVLAYVTTIAYTPEGELICDDYSQSVAYNSNWLYVTIEKD